MLPALGSPDDDRALADVLALVGGDIPLAPTARLDDGRLVHVVGARGMPPEGSFVAPEALEDGLLGRAVARAITELDPAHTPERRPDWFRPGWFDRLEAWIDVELAPSGRRRSGPVEPFRLWSLSAVVRVPTTDGTLWCKAPCDHFRAEATIHAAVARVLPELVPQLVAIEPSLGWALMAPMAGADAEAQPAGAAAEAARRWAEAQIASIEHVPELLDAGLEHRGAAATTSAFERILTQSRELSLLDRAELIRIRAAAGRAMELTRECWAAGLPETLAHGDLHPGNVAWDGVTLRIFDWTDGCVSTPFLDGAHLVRGSDDADAAAVAAAYAAPWRSAFPAVDVDRVLAIAPLADLVFQTVTFEAIAAATEPGSAWELGGIVARNLRQLPAMVARAG